MNSTRKKNSLLSRTNDYYLYHGLPETYFYQRKKSQYYLRSESDSVKFNWR